MNDLWRAKSYLKLEIEYLNKGVFIRQETYIIKMLKMFQMDKSCPLCTPIVVRLLDVDKESF